MYHSNFHADRVSVEYVDQLAQRRSNFHADRGSVECVDQLAQRRSYPTTTQTVSPSTEVRYLIYFNGLVYLLIYLVKFFLNLSWCRQTVSPSSAWTSLPSAAPTSTQTVWITVRGGHLEGHGTTFPYSTCIYVSRCIYHLLPRCIYISYVL